MNRELRNAARQVLVRAESHPEKPLPLYLVALLKKAIENIERVEDVK